MRSLAWFGLVGVVWGDLLCQGGGRRACGWHCALQEQGAGRCVGGAGEEVGGVEEGAEVEGNCTCAPEWPPAIPADYFSRKLQDVEGAAATSGLPHFIQQVAEHLSTQRAMKHRSTNYTNTGDIPASGPLVPLPEQGRPADATEVGLSTFVCL